MVVIITVISLPLNGVEAAGIYSNITNEAINAMNLPACIVVDDSGNIYEAELNGEKIQKFDAMHTFVGAWGTSDSGNMDFFNPNGIAYYAGYIYLADTMNWCIKKINASTGEFVSKYGDGSSYFPYGIAIDGVGGYIYVADTLYSVVHKLKLSDGSTVVEWNASGAIYGEPNAVAVGSDGIYVADRANNTIIKLDATTGDIDTSWGDSGSIGGYGAGNSNLNSPRGVAVDSSDNIYVADSGNNRIMKFESTGEYITKWGIFGTGDGQFSNPNNVAVDSNGIIYVADTENNRVVVIDSVLPTISSSTAVAASNEYIDVTFSEAVRGASDGTTKIDASKFGVNFIQGSGTATDASITSITKTGGGEIDGSETTVRFYLNVLGTSNGLETIEIKPIDGNSVYDKAGNAMLAEQTGGVKNLKDLTAPEMNVKGNNTSIADGDTTPETADHTDFSTADITGGTVVRTFTIANTGTANLNLTGTTKIVEVSGANASDFTVTQPLSATVAALGTITFYVTFDPTETGLETANISISNNDSNENPYNFSIQGTGTVTNAVAPTIATQPVAKTVNVNAAASLSVAASASGTLSYQWYSNTTASTTGASAIATAISETYTAPTSTAGTTYYYCVVTNTDDTKSGITVATTTSDIVAVTANALTNAVAPTITTQPVAKTVNVNAAASLSVAASASGTLSYQWYSNTTASTTGASAIATAISETYTAPTSTAGTTYYYCVVTNTDDTKSGITVATTTSDIVAVTANALTNAVAPTITTQPVAKTVNVNAAASLSVAASASGTLSYQWYSNTTASTTGASAIATATSAAYTAPTSTVGTTYYYCVVTNTDDTKSGITVATTTSDIVAVITNSLTDAAAPTIATQPVAKTVNVNAAASLSVAASASGTLSYQWYSNTTASTTGASAINTATSAAYSAPTSTVGTTYYYCVVTNTDDTKSGITVATTTSDIVAVITNSLTDAVAPTITTQLQNATVNVGGTATLSVVASATSGTLTYQWYSNSTNTTSGAIAINTATSASYTAPTNTIGTNYYYCIVTNTDSNASGNTTSTATTNAAKVVVNELTNAAAPTIATQPVAKTVNVNATASLSVAASASGTLSYQWYSNTTNSTTGASAIATAISATYQVPTSSAGTTYYYCVVTNTDNAKTGIKVATNTSAIVAVTVNELTNATAPTITTQLQDKTVSINEANELSVTAASSSGILTYQWYSNSNDSTNGAVAITNATGAAIQVPTDILGTTYYFCIVTNTDSSASGTTTATATTNAAKVVVNELTNATAPTITTQLQNKIVSINEAVELSVTASSSGILTYQWYSNTENSTIGSVEITNTTGAAIQVPTNTTGTTYYYCIITSTDNTKTGANTATATSAIVAVTVNENVVPTTYILTYTAEANGTITGTAAQTVEQGASGSTVTATPNSGYHFVKWSDDVTAATRTDSNVAGNIAVSASFAINESSPSPDTTPTPPKNLPASTGVNILVNGVVQTAATSETTKVDDKTVTTVTIDDKKIEEKLKNEGNNAIITIPVNNNSDVVVGQLNGQTVKNMETKEAVLEIKTENVTYTLPASQINIDSVSKQIGEQVLLKDITVNVSISKSSDKTAQIVEDTANKNNYQLVVKPIDFEITCTSGGKTVDVSRFNGYVQRTAAIPDGVDPTKITTGIVLNNDGTFSHVPTQIITINGKLFAKINSLTNSTYSVLWHPLEFKDVEKHWAKEAINDMGSRLVITGIGDDNFAPNRDIIRAEFAAIIVKALGLKPLAGKNTFSDVNETAWYSQYVETAYEYNIIAGVGKGKFAPTDMITREQAVTMIAKAMKITNLKTVLAAGEIDSLLKEYSDTGKTAAWAKENVAICIKNGIISGKGKLVAPKDNITRAEVAVIVRKLLQKSNLIN